MYAKKKIAGGEPDSYLVPAYARGALESRVPRYRMPQAGMLPETAYDIIRDELMLDGNARLNLASFVTTWMEPQAERLMRESFDKNIIDHDEYPQTAEIESRCVNIIARLWNSPENEEAMGTSTIGSSEAAMLAGMALLKRWRQRRRDAGRPADRPNLVMGINIQVCWEKFCTYWDVEPRYVPMETGRYHLGAKEAAALCDENTIGVVAIMGSTYDGSYEPVAEVSRELDRLEQEQGLDIPVHVDAASGGFIAPFLEPELEWDFRVPRVCSINASGHKYGLVYPGVGWVVWRSREALPEELVFEVSYLGGKMPTFSLNFSRPASQVVAQYYNFLRLGRDGYRRVLATCRDTALYLSHSLAENHPEIRLVSDGGQVPAFAFSIEAEDAGFTVFDLSQRLRDRGWQVPAYHFPRNCEQLAVMRIVVREGFNRDLADVLLADFRRHLEWFAAHPEHRPRRSGSHFRH